MFYKLLKLVKSFKNDEGWTFVELIIGIAIVLLLAGGVGVYAVKYLDKASVTTAINDIEGLNLALELYRQDCKRYPTQEQGLDALWEKPVLSPVPSKWNGPYLSKKLPLDPWDNDYVYSVPGDNGLPFKVISLGRDGTVGGVGLDADIDPQD